MDKPTDEISSMPSRNSTLHQDDAQVLGVPHLLPPGGSLQAVTDIETQKENLRTANQKLLVSLKGLRHRIRCLRETITVGHDVQQENVTGRIKWLERELGCIDVHEFFSQQELDDLIVYVNNNPYLRSLLEKRNAKLLKTLMASGSALPTVVAVDFSAVTKSLPEPASLVSTASPDQDER